MHKLSREEPPNNPMPVVPQKAAGDCTAEVNNDRIRKGLACLPSRITCKRIPREKSTGIILQKTFFLDGVVMRGDLETNLQRIQKGADKENPTRNGAGTGIPSSMKPTSTPRVAPALRVPPTRPDEAVALATVPIPNLVPVAPHRSIVIAHAVSAVTAPDISMAGMRNAIDEAKTEIKNTIIQQHEQSRSQITEHVTAQHNQTRDHTTNGVIALMDHTHANSKASFLALANRLPPATSTALPEHAPEHALESIVPASIAPDSSAAASIAPEATAPDVIAPPSTKTESTSIAPESIAANAIANEPIVSPKRVKEWAAGIYTPAVNAARGRRAERIRRRAVIANGSNADWMPAGWVPVLAAAAMH